MTVSDAQAESAMRLLAAGTHGDVPRSRPANRPSRAMSCVRWQRKFDASPQPTRRTGAHNQPDQLALHPQPGYKKPTDGVGPLGSRVTTEARP